MGDKRDSTKCKWMCTCKDPTVPKARGRAWHHQQCHRNRWINGDLTMGEPVKGEQVFLLGNAGAAAGKMYQFNGKQWSAL